jgi:hypothetical protein
MPIMRRILSEVSGGRMVWSDGMAGPERFG